MIYLLYTTRDGLRRENQWLTPSYVQRNKPTFKLRTKYSTVTSVTFRCERPVFRLFNLLPPHLLLGVQMEDGRAPKYEQINTYCISLISCTFRIKNRAPAAIQVRFLCYRSTQALNLLQGYSGTTSS